MLTARTPRAADEQIQNRMRPEWVETPDPTRCDQTANEEMKAHTHFMRLAWNGYVPRPYAGRVSIIWPEDGGENPFPWNPRAVWRRLTPNAEWQVAPGNHYTMLHEDIEHSARMLGAFIERSYARATSKLTTEHTEHAENFI